MQSPSDLVLCENIENYKNAIKQWYVAIFFGIGGLFFIYIGYLLQSGSYPNNPFSVFYSLGASLIVTGLVSTILKLLYENHEKKIFPIKKDIENVFEKRSSTYEIILKEMEKSTNIFMLATAHRSFLWKETKNSHQFYDIISDKKKNVRIVLANPFCEQLIRRTLIEESVRLKVTMTGSEFEEISDTIKEIKWSISKLCDKILDKPKINNNNHVRIKFSNDYPLMWLIITDSYAFFQPYQYGNLIKNPCMGENFFILQIRYGIIYSRLLSHFVTIYNQKDNCSIDQIKYLLQNNNGITMIDGILAKLRSSDPCLVCKNNNCPKDEIIIKESLIDFN